MTTPISLYLAESVADLRNYIVPHRSAQPLTLERLNKLYEEVENNAKQQLHVKGDQELAYLTYCKALELLNLMRKCKEFSQKTKKFQYKYEQQRTDCEQIEYALRLELEERYRNFRSTSYVTDSIKSSSLHKLPEAPYRIPTSLDEREITETTTVLDDFMSNYEEDEEYFPTDMTFNKRLAATRSSLSMSGDRQVQIPRPSSSQQTVYRAPQILMRKPHTRECVVCVNEKSIADFGEVFSTICQHVERQICTDCVRENTIRIVNDRSTTDVRCPEQNCDAIFDFDTVRRILIDFNTSVGQFEDRLSKGCVETMKSFIWCAHRCGWGCQLDGSSGNIFTCRRCKQKTCAHHQVKWHSGITCAEYDQTLSSDREETKNQNWLKDHTKKCPKCNVSIEKNDGCDHMTCCHCKYEFCWICLADFQRIRIYDNKYHVPDCKYYA
ncbi:unnamed protein product [Adineta steineri]|uniref:RBR-type E3 ubiquitin transferase n=2 Tax=Adineta steineri TaxID=433720 RepID=A0A815D9V4_9BILA|nr:unnamed protein product [Adineta steineri]CAF1295023.1 unnamed protein product [Adineta steineri]CAF3893257.1 unnamed protein product [Adineta steineri]CAF4072328.1 unnamed protein product [Adineta steineri]